MSDATNYIELRGKIDTAKSISEIEKLLKQYELDHVSVVRQAVSKLCYDRDYRRGRNVSIAEKDAEIAKLRKQVAAK
jgi:hypothetical protein